MDPDDPPASASAPASDSPAENSTIASPSTGGLLSEEDADSPHLRKPSDSTVQQEESRPGISSSRLLWVGNVSADVSEALLIQLFAKYGTVDNVSAYPSRSYAFIEFKDLEDAQAAKSGLQGKLVKGQSLRIEFAKAAKPSRHLWIWGVSESLTKEKLEAEFRKFGPLEDFKLLRDRNSALAEFKNIQDASAAIKGLNKKSIHGDELRVDFLRSQPVKRGHTGHENSPQIMSDEKMSKEGEPSDTLWIGFPPPSKVDEEGLRRAFLLFGEVERITTVPDRSYCFVQFRNVDEATRAKDGLQGRLLNDPRILIRFSSNEGAPKRIPKGDGSFYPQIHQRGPLVHPDVVGSRMTHSSVEWPTSSMMHLTSRQSAFHHDANRPVSLGYGRQMGGGGSMGSMPDMHGVPFGNNELFSNNRLSTLGDFGAWPSVIEDHSNIREHKRAKIGLSSYSVGGLDDDSMRLAYSTTRSMHSGSLAETPMTNWKGAIAKGGSIICRVQSFPVGKGIDGPLPEILNCVARTSLDTLAQHFDQASDSRVVCFIPDGDEERPSYYSFVSYLHDKCRSGVANLVDGTAMFLVPPSDFATKVLKLHGDYLFGLVMNPYRVEDTPQANPQKNEYAYQQQCSHSYSNVADLSGLLNKFATGRLPNQSENMPDLVSLLTSILTMQRNMATPDDFVGLSSGGLTSVSGSEVTPHEAASNVNNSMQNQLSFLQKLLSGPLSAIEQDQKMANNHQSNSDNSTIAAQMLVKQMLLGQRTPEPSVVNTAIMHQNDSSDESKNRFQATLELAAALLQRIQSVSGSQGAS